MRLVLKQAGKALKEFQFDKGPIKIGRHAKSDVLLAKVEVSRKHALISNTEDGNWTIEQLSAAGKTFLNDDQIQKAQIKTGDVIRIYDFTIEINLAEDTAEPVKIDTAETEQPKLDNAELLEDTKSGSAMNMQATLATPPHEIVVRKADPANAPAMRLDGKRISEFSQATEELRTVKDLDELLRTLLDILLKQFGGYHVWCALRDKPTGPMTYHAGKKHDGKPIQLNELPLAQKINDAVERGQFLVLPRVAPQIESEMIRSALIAPIKGSAGCFGVLYIDNAMIKKHYALGDLDYLIFLTIHVAAIMKDLF